MDIGRHILKFLLISAAVAAVFACKKDDEEQEILPSLGGSLRFDAEPYILQGDSLTFVPSGIYHPDGAGIGFYWQVSPSKEAQCTTKVESDPSTVTGQFGFRFRNDTLGTFTVSCTAFASGYYSTTSSRYITVVDPAESVIDSTLGFDESRFTYFKDERDGHTYRYVRIGSYDWFAKNLAYKGTDGAEVGIAYENAEAMSDVFGRYYTWNEAMGIDGDGAETGTGICPPGWEVPDSEAWLDLANSLSADGEGSFTNALENFDGIAGKMMVDAKFNSADNGMWEYFPDVQITNESGLCIIPCGFANIAGGSGTFESVNLFAAFWTADSNTENQEQAFIRYINVEAPDLFITSTPKTSFGATVRCVRKTE